MSIVRLAKLFAVLGTVMLALSGCIKSNKTSISVNYYQVGGHSLKQIDREIRKKGPKNGREHAVAISNIKMLPDIAIQSAENSCHISRARIKVIAKVTLPQWTNRGKAKKQLGATWDNLDRYTRLHESVHVAIADKYARQLENSLMELKPTRTCDETEKLAGFIITKTMKSHHLEQKKFDSDEKARFTKLSKNRKKS